MILSFRASDRSSRTGLFATLTLACLSACAQDADRPDGWSEASHSNDARPDYETLFAMDRVHEMHIEIAADDFVAMQEDLQTIGPAGIEGFFGGRGGFPGGGFPPPGGPSGRGGFGGAAPELTSRDPIYVQVTVTHDGRIWPGVGMRYKGNSSLMMSIMSGNGKVPFRLDFDRYEDEVPGTDDQRFYGFHKLTFSSNFTDDSMLKEVLATEVFRDNGVPAARAAFYRIMIDVGEGPEYWGLYTMIEDPADGAMLNEQFGGRGGNLYKPSGPGADWTIFDQGGFDKKTNEDEADYADVIAAVDALHAPKDDPAAWRDALEAQFNVDGFLRWLAVNTVIENWDSYGRLAHNYYLYGDPAEDGRLNWVPWDHNMSFGMGGGGFPGGMMGGFGRRGFPGGGEMPFPPPGGGFGGGMPPFFGGGGDDVLHSDVGDAWPLIGRILDEDVYAARYRALLGQVLDEGLFAPDAFEARARELHEMIAPYVVGEQGERSTHTTLSSVAGFEQAVESLLTTVANRREQVRDAIGSE